MNLWAEHIFIWMVSQEYSSYQRQKPTRKWPMFRHWDKGISILLYICICKTVSNIGYFVFSQLQTGRRLGYFGEMILDHSTRVYQKLSPYSYSSSDFLCLSLVDVDVYSSIFFSIVLSLPNRHLKCLHYSADCLPRICWKFRKHHWYISL